MGFAVGTAVGSAVGTAVGSAVGTAVGSAVGTAVGSAVGTAVGSAVGCAVGAAASKTVKEKLALMPWEVTVACRVPGWLASKPVRVYSPAASSLGPEG